MNNQPLCLPAPIQQNQQSPLCSNCKKCFHIVETRLHGMTRWSCGKAKIEGYEYYRTILTGQVSPSTIAPPFWCPLAQKQELSVIPPTKTKTFWEIRDEWKKITPKIKWGDFKEKDILYIPPIIDKPSRTVEVVSFLNNRLRVKVYDGTLLGSYLFIDPYDLEARYLVRKTKLSNKLLSFNKV